MRPNDDIDKAIAKMVAGTQKEIVKNYKRAYNSIRIELIELYEKHANQEGKLTYAQMARYNHLNNLEKNIAKEMQKATGLNAEEIVKVSGESYNEAFLRTAFKIEKEIKAELGFGLPSKKAIARSVQNPIEKLTLNQRLKKNRANVISTIKNEITQGLIVGESYDKIANRIKTTLEQDTAKAVRVARTETHRNQCAGRMDSMDYAKEKGVQMKKQWVSGLDLRTRDWHGAADGQIVETDEPFLVDGEELMYPGDPAGSGHNVINCRCSMISIIENYEPQERRAGKEVIEYTTYKKWYETNYGGE